MIKLPSLQKEYTLIFSGDEALALPIDETERENALRVARETGNWTPLLKAGAAPTIFHVRPIDGTDFSWLASERSRKRWSDLELAEWALRMALRKVDNFGEYKVEIGVVEGHDVATRDIVNALYGDESQRALGRSIVMELGLYIFTRNGNGISPKS